MIFELIATVAAGFASAGVVMLLRHLTRGRVPRPMIPIVAGLAMIGFVIWSEYSWADRTRAGLPEGFEVIRETESSAAWRPWTLIAPYTHGMIAVDTSGILRNSERPELALIDLYVFGRWRPTSRVPQVVDCDRGVRSDLAAPGDLDPEADRPWVQMSEDDPLLAAACV